MFRTIADFEASWKTESEATQKILKALTDASLAQRVTPEGRTLGKLAWHIIQSVPEMLTTAKLPLGYPGTEPPIPAHAAEFVTAWDRWSSVALGAVKGNWGDAALLEEIEMYGEKWTRGLTLSIVITHATHHRGQMTVLMRQAGLVVPGVYGPAREEWAAYGAPPQE
jgi:uncharacterized damage-inducible protein DinB